MIRKKAITVVFLANILFGQFEVIKISDDLSGPTADRLWPVLKGGSITIREGEIVIPNGPNIFIQNRLDESDNTIVDLKLPKEFGFNVYEATANDSFLAYTGIADDGFFYVFKKKRNKGAIEGPIIRQGLTAERMFLLKDDRLMVTSLHRPILKDYVRKYIEMPLSKQREDGYAHFTPLYDSYQAYTVSVYDKNFTEVDTGNIINRTGENARAFEGLYLTHPVDTASGEVVYLIDNDQGYVVEKYANLTEFESSFRVINSQYKRIPQELTMDDMHALHKADGAYSIPYGLYYKHGFILSCFFQAPQRYEDIEPPYYFDISTAEGKHLYSGQLEYPFLCEDTGSRLFLYTKHRGGWFEDDEHYLVGVTIQDLLSGSVSKSAVDKQINTHMKE